jgi:hypothetical protein
MLALSLNFDVLKKERMTTLNHKPLLYQLFNTRHPLLFVVSILMLTHTTLMRLIQEHSLKGYRVCLQGYRVCLQGYRV